MKRQFSISYKWALLLGTTIVVLLAIGVLFNKLFYFDYYLNREKEEIYRFAEELNELVDDTEAFEEKIDRYVLSKSVTVTVIGDIERRFAFAGSNKGNRGDIKAPIPGVLPKDYKEILSKDGHYYFNFEHEQLSTNLLGLIYALDNEEYVLITMPYEGLNNVADIAIGFNLKIAIVLIALAMIVVGAIARQMTKPIIKLSTVTSKIAQLDFSSNVTVSSNDEIGQLGENINLMSSALEQTLTDLKDANAQLINDIKEKEKIVEMRKSLVANVSHELKTPLALILSYAEGLSNNNALDEEKQSYYLEVIEKEANHMNKMVRDLLDLSELEFDAFSVSKADMDLSSLIDEIMDRYIGIISEKKIKIKYIKSDIIPVHADKMRLEQALTNLIVNALEYTPFEGSVEIRVFEEEHTRVEIYNSGSYIPEADLQEVWTSFYKGKSEKRKIGGSGIGLSIVKSVIDKHDGAYGCFNDNGVVFWFEI